MKQIGRIKPTEFDTPEKKIRYYTADEFRRYIAVAKERAEKCQTLTDWDYYVFFMIAFFTGMRKGEINALKWSDIDGDTIRIRRSVNQKLKGADRETETKNGPSIRDIRMPQPLIDALAAHRKRYESESGFTVDWRICGGQKSLRDTPIEKRNSSYAKAAGRSRAGRPGFMDTLDGFGLVWSQFQ